MINRVKTKLWEILKKKDISLAILFDKKGEILWNKGRTIVGKDIFNGRGFSKSYIQQILKGKHQVDEEDILIDINGDQISKSANFLRIKSLMIIPVNSSYYLYIDSGIKENFSPKDKSVFQIMGEMLGDIIGTIQNHESDVGGITGQSPVIAKIRKLVLKYSLEEEAVLLLGETGVGKSHIAELIHQYSGKKGKFVTVHTPGIPNDLFESEIFGHTQGAFTGAMNDQAGFIDEANEGTLFFDEICDIPLILQAKLLRFIETKKYSRLGDPIQRVADIRIIAATNRDLNIAMSEELFRRDLYYRLNTLEILIPPLRDRREDIKAITKEKNNLLKDKELTKDFWDEMLNYSWPGNIRELFSILTRVGLNDNDRFTGEDFKKMISLACISNSKGLNNSNIKRIQFQIKAGQNFWDAVRKPFMNRDINREEVKEIIENALIKGTGKYKKAIKYLNLPTSDHKKFLDFINDHNLK